MTEEPVREGVFAQFRWFEDFAPGQRFRFGDWEMRADEMLAFARRYDPEPFHLDAATARGLGWDGLMASGLQVVSIWRRLSVDAFPNCQTVISPGWDDVRWLRPVYAGDRLASETAVVATRRLASRPGEGLVRLASRILGADGQPVASLLANWFVRCRG